MLTAQLITYINKMIKDKSKQRIKNNVYTLEYRVVIKLNNDLEFLGQGQKIFFCTQNI